MIHLPFKSATKNLVFAKNSHQKRNTFNSSKDPKNWEALQLLDLPSSLEPNIILMNSVSWRNPQCWRKFQLWGLVWFDWLVGVVGWLKWLSPPSGLVQVVWLSWSCNLQGLFGSAKDSTRNGNGWQDMSEGNFWRGQKSYMASFCWLYPEN